MAAKTEEPEGWPDPEKREVLLPPNAVPVVRADDLALLKTLCDATNRGLDIKEICRILCSGTRQVFQSNGATVYLLSADRQHLDMQHMNLPERLVEQIQRLIGISIPVVSIPLREDSLYLKALRAGSPVVFREPELIKNLAVEFTDNPRLKKLVPSIYRLLNIDTVVELPLLVHGEAIGLMEMSRSGAFTTTEIERLAFLAPCLTNIIRNKIAEEALAMKNTLLTAASETMMHGIMIVDRSDRIVLSNRRFQDMWAVPPEVIGSGDNSRVLACIASRLKESEEFLELARQLQGCTDVVEQQGLSLKDGRTIERYSAPLLDQEGAYQGRIWYFRDVTLRKNAEARERQLQQEINRASRLAAVGELAAGVAHELNNPLTVVIGFTQRLMRKNTDQKVGQDLEKIYHEAQRSARVVQNLLCFARRRQTERACADINDIVQKALELRAYELRANGIEVAMSLAPGLPRVTVDFQQIQEVFLSIILNAEQAMVRAGKGGRLEIRTGLEQEDIAIVFTDNGPGISRENLDHIFNPFFSTREGEEGTGLGLSICHNIMIEHGGRIYVKSRLGEGASFTVILPGEDPPADPET